MNERLRFASKEKKDPFRITGFASGKQFYSCLLSIITVIMHCGLMELISFSSLNKERSCCPGPSFWFTFRLNIAVVRTLLQALKTNSWPINYIYSKYITKPRLPLSRLSL